MKPLSLIRHLNVRRLCHGLALGAMLATWLSLAAPVRANEAESASLAASVPIADVHMHLYRGLTPEELRAAMDRNNVRWGGGVGPVGPGYDPLEFGKVLGPR
ncbi:hypothetical protein, partial [Curvibacter delicatus]|uniref:hypothetical protein n=1 Tax=Curvibacter delicatus TaxID=80879 RepID=UPI0012ECD327